MEISGQPETNNDTLKQGSLEPAPTSQFIWWKIALLSPALGQRVPGHTKEWVNLGSAER